MQPRVAKKSSQEVISPRWQKGKEVGRKASPGIKAMIILRAKAKESKKEMVGAITLGQRVADLE